MPTTTCRTLLMMSAMSFGLLGCATSPPPPPAPRAPPLQLQAAQAAAKALEERRRVNENWSADCIVDKITTSRRCFAATFGRPMKADGTPFMGQATIPLEVFYVDSAGPFLQIGFNTFPGRDPTVRVDDGVPYTFPERAPPAALLAELRAGRVLRGRYYVWPRGAADAIFDLTGIEEALSRLGELRNRRP